MAGTMIWRETSLRWALVAVLTVALAFVFWDGLVELEDLWSKKEEYSHAYLLPIISLFLVWQKSEKLRQLPLEGSWLGIPVVVTGILLGFAGSLSTIYLVVHYSILITLTGVVLTYLGRQGLMLLWAPLLLLFFAIPLPPFLYNAVSLKLQLISSELGVATIRLFGISVFLEGNVIDLGSYKLQVVEACNGLRYLFPLMSIAFIMAYFFRVSFWKRTLVFLASIPLTIIMNSIRIGIIGVMVEYWGTDMAEGFLHDFEGWLFFMVCMVMLMGIMWLVYKTGSEKRSFQEVFGIDYPRPPPKNASVKLRSVPVTVYGLLLVLGIASVVTPILEGRQDAVVNRTSLDKFPIDVGSWRGQRDRIKDIYLEELDLTDYVIADYVDERRRKVNFYAAYYASQRAGESAHSPQSCLPGGGWKINKITQQKIDNVLPGNVSININRVQIQMGESKILVYYWFQQRGRVITNEYLVKWYLLVDGLQRNRTDGALVRLTTMIAPDEEWRDGDEKIVDFMRDMTPILKDYVPD